MSDQPPGGSRPIWHKGSNADERLLRFSIGEDPQLDPLLAEADLLGNIAQAVVLHRIGLIDEHECAALLTALRSLFERLPEAPPQLGPHCEDIHSWTEARLTEALGPLGAKIHTGRSRNDQVCLDLRLTTRERLTELAAASAALARRFLASAEAGRELLMPGYTHLQQAMPSSWAVWAGSYAELLSADAAALLALADELNQSPLGAAAGYGVPLDMQREFSARLLGFAGPVNNVLAAVTSRPRDAWLTACAAARLSATLSQAAADLILFSSREFGFLRLPDALTTGSSIMPQKRNPDLLELVRASSATLHGMTSETYAVFHHLPGGYYRDHQASKGPHLRSLLLASQLVEIMALAVEGLQLNPQAMSAACGPELFVTHETYQRVRAGVPFRQAYREVGSAYLAGELEPRVPPLDELMSQTASLGSMGNPALNEITARLSGLDQSIQQRAAHWGATRRTLLTATVSELLRR